MGNLWSDDIWAEVTQYDELDELGLKSLGACGCLVAILGVVLVVSWFVLIGV